MGIPKTVRFEDDLETKIEEYLDKNDLKFTQLLNLAVSKYISETQTIELIPVKTIDFLKSAKEAFEEHKDAMDKLK